MIPECLKHNTEVLGILLLTRRMYQNIMDKHHKKGVLIWLKYLSYQVHKCYRAISQPKRLDEGLVMPITSPKNSLLNIICLDPQLIMPITSPKSSFLNIIYLDP